MKLLKVAAALLCVVGLTAFASTSSVTATLIDPDGVVWGNCTWSAVVSSAVPPTIAGTAVPDAQLRANGSCSSSGVITATMLNTSSVQQNGVTWNFTIQPNASVAPSVVSGVAVTGTTINLSTALSSGLTAPRFGAGPNSYGYADVEINSSSNGNTYFNTGTACSATGGMRQLSLSGWQCGGGGGSGSNPSTTALAGATIDYNFLDGTGTTVTDISGNSNSGTLGIGLQAPTWNTTGLVFNPVNAQGVALPAAANAGKTFMFGIYINPLVQDGSQPGNQYHPILSDNVAGASLNFSILRTTNASGFDAAYTFSPTVYKANHITGSADPMSGFTVLALVCGLGGADKDHLYLNGVEVAAYIFQGTACSTAFTGNLFLGASNVSPWVSTGFYGTYYRFAVFPTQLTAAVIAKNTATITADVQSRGVPVAPKDVVQTAPQLYGVGDSITFGINATTPWLTLLALTNQPAYVITNYGISGITTKATIASEPNRVMPKCKTASGPAVATLMLGTNEFNTALGQTPTQVWASNVAEIQLLKRAGCLVFVATMISRGGNGLLGGISNDVSKNQFDALILSNARAVGADGIIDFAANPVMGADGANASATYFQGDHIHPTNAGHVQMSIAASNSLNYYFGSKLANPTVITATTYQMLSGDGAVTAAPTATAAFTMPDCTGPSGEIYTISNTSAFVVTIVGINASQPINGLTAPINIPANSTVTLKDVANPKATSGCHWAM